MEEGNRKRDKTV